MEFHIGELFPRVGFIVTNLSLPSRAIVRFYNKRGTAEQWIKEGKQATHWTRLSCHRFRANEALLQLSLLAYNLGNLWRRLVLPKRIQARPILLGGACGESPHAASVWPDTAADPGATDAIWLATPIAVTKSGAERGSSAEWLRDRFRGNKRGASDGQKSDGRNPAACWGLLESQISCVDGRRSIRMREVGVQIGNPHLNRPLSNGVCIWTRLALILTYAAKSSPSSSPTMKPRPPLWDAPETVAACC